MTMSWTKKSLLEVKCVAQDENGDVENWIPTLGNRLETRNKAQCQALVILQFPNLMLCNTTVQYQYTDHTILASTIVY